MLPSIRASISSLLLPLCFASSLSAQFDYSVAVDASEHAWSVECEFENPSGEDFEFWLARWTAGAYHRADYGRFVEDFVAAGADGEFLEVERRGETHFGIRAAGHKKITLNYRARSMSQGVFSNGVIDVESNRITSDYAFLNPVSLLGFVPSRLEEAYAVRFELPEGWQSACVLEADGSGSYRAPSYYRMEDSPFLFSPGLRTVELEAGGKRLSVSAHGLQEKDMDELVEDCFNLVEAASDLLGGLPFEHYEFLFGFVPKGGGSGLEHSYSTLILVPFNSRPAANRGLISHEFFHLWCAERIHVQALQKPDYTKLFDSSTIWVNESITEYMSVLLMLQAGMLGPEEVLAQFSEPSAQLEAMAQAGLLMPGTEASRKARDWADINALMGFAASVYQNGSRVIFALDMEMRRASQGERGVLDLVKHLMREYVDKDRGFPEDGMPQIINHVAGADLSAFFDAHIDDLQPLDMAAHLGVIGYGLQHGKLRELASPSQAQLKARADYFSPQR